MKKKIAIIIIIIIFIFLTLICMNILSKNNKPTINTENSENNATKNITESNNTQVNTSENIMTEELNTDTNNMVTSLPNDAGLTVNGVPKTFNQDITAQANISYLLGCKNITNSTNFVAYIDEHVPNNGIFISDISGYKETNNSYDFTKKRTEMMKEMLASIDLIYNIDENNYLINNQGNSDIEQKINRLISGNKKIIIGFIPEYYVYINDIDNSLGFGGFNNSSYVSLKPYNNIYTFIFDSNSTNANDFLCLIDEICQLAD